MAESLFGSRGCCSVQSYVGTLCSHAPRDKTRSIVIVPLISCKKDISNHKKSLAIFDVENEVELILARCSIFSISQSLLNELTICPSHRFKLGLGWYRCSQKCQVPSAISRHDNSNPRKWPKAERGIGKIFSKVILEKTGQFIPVGSGKSS